MTTAASQGRTPIWVPILLGFQLLLTLVIFALSAMLIHGFYFTTLGFDIFLCLLTWLLVIYHFLTIYVTSLQKLRFAYVALITSAVMVIFWLSAMGASAYLRSVFTSKVNVYGCSDDGSSVGAVTCVTGKRDNLENAIVTDAGLVKMSTIAGLSALVLITYIFCLVVEIMAVVKNRKSTAGAGAPQKQNEVGYEGYRMEQPVHTIPVQQEPKYDAQLTYAQQPYPYAPTPAQQFAQQPYSNASTPQPYQGTISPQSTHQYAQQPYSNSPTPQPQEQYQISQAQGTQQPYQTTTSPGPQGSYVQPHVQQDDVHEMSHGADVQRPYEK